MTLPPQIIQSDFVPKLRLIQDVTVSRQAVITTTIDHGYETGYIVRVFVPKPYGMVINYSQSEIIVTGTNTFLTNIDTTSLAPFVAPTYPPAFTSAQVTVVNGVTDNIAGDP